MKYQHAPWLFASLLLLVFTATSAPAPAQPRGSDDHHCMMQEHGMGMMDQEHEMGAGECRGMGIEDGDGHGMRDQFGKLWHMDLSPEQRSRLNKLQYDLRRQHWNMKGRMIDEQAKLYDLYAAEKPDAKRIGSVYGAIFDLRRQMIEASIDAMNRAQDILTREQKARLQQLKQGCMAGSGPQGMKHEMMSGGSGTR